MSISLARFASVQNDWRVIDGFKSVVAASPITSKRECDTFSSFGSCPPLRTPSRDDGEDGCLLCGIRVLLLALVVDAELLVELPDFGECRFQGADLRERLEVAHVVRIGGLPAESVQLLLSRLGDLVPVVQKGERGRVGLGELAALRQLVPFRGLDGVYFFVGDALVGVCGHLKLAIKKRPGEGRILRAKAIKAKLRVRLRLEISQ